MSVKVSVKEMNIVDRFCEVYTRLNAENVDLIDEIYDPNIVFIDPLHRIEGIRALKQYMYNMYLNLSDYSVEIKETLHQQDVAYIHWDMVVRHPKLKRGEAIAFTGVSRLQFQEKIIRHQDFFDVGAMLYEHLPVLGRAVGWVKRRAGS